jgi:hypothetical protein
VQVVAPHFLEHRALAAAAQIEARRMARPGG